MFEKVDRSGRRERNWDAYAAVIASLVGLLALAVSAYTANLQRTQVRAQVWPRVELMWYGSAHKIVALSQGMGPARISMVRITVDGKPMKDWHALTQAMGPIDGYTQTQFSGRVMPPGSEVFMFETRDSDVGREFFTDMQKQTRHKVGILACYCSVLGDCWLAGLGDTPDVDLESEGPIDHCPISREQRFIE